MEPSYLIMGIVQKFYVQCPKCKGRITTTKDLRANTHEFLTVGTTSVHHQDDEFEVTLVCGARGCETRVSKSGFEACIQH